MLYFAYGSNMSTPRLESRVRSANAISVAGLHGHKLRFRKKSISGSGKCDVENTGDPGDVVYGVVFEIASSDKAALDKIEGLGKWYEEKNVIVVSATGEKFEAVTYFAINIDASMKPCDWYKEHVLRGAREHGIPVEYIKDIEAIESTPDPDNYDKEMEIYREQVHQLGQ
jgi:cation transport regulator ChaC